MSSCISEEAFTAQQMKTDEEDPPFRLDRASVALMQMHNGGVSTVIYTTSMCLARRLQLSFTFYLMTVFFF